MRKLPAVAAVLFFVSFVWAGPPFVTDDPEPVELHHWEFYYASLLNHDVDGNTGTAPHFEVNYGAFSETQLHVIVPLAYSDITGNSFEYGLGDIEIGVKYRLIRENDSRPQVGVFPLVELASGDSGKGLGSGHTSAFIPLWIQKSWGPWTMYGGGGYWFNKTAAGDKDYIQAGWLLQRDFSDTLTIGAELFSLSPSALGDSGEVGLNAGAMVNFDQSRHLLFSIGRDVNRADKFFAYAAFQLTI